MGDLVQDLEMETGLRLNRNVLNVPLLGHYSSCRTGAVALIDLSKSN